jgi:uncharacterized RDD family membrane protein YckC
MKPTSVFRRLAAFIIDHIVVMTLLAIVSFIFAKSSPEPSHTLMDSAKELLNKTIELFPGQEPSFSSKLAEKFSYYFVHMKSTVFICGILYFVYFVSFERSKWQGTIGKKLLKLKVTDDKNKKLSIAGASKRFFIFAAPSLLVHSISFFGYPECISARSHFMKSGIEFPSTCIALLVVYAVSYSIWLIPIFFTKDKATSYDILSNTKVNNS